jgi:hypothetical protein
MTVSVPAAEAGLLLQARGVAAAGFDRDGREIHHQLGFSDGFDQSSFFEYGIQDGVVGGQVEQDDIDPTCRVCRRYARLGAGLSHPLGDDVVGPHAPAEIGEALHHRQAHQADADVAEREGSCVHGYLIL